MNQPRFLPRRLLLAAGGGALLQFPRARAQSKSLPPARQQLRLAIQSETTSIDPHFSQLSPNQTVAAQIFEGLLSEDEKLRPAPGLAQTWRAVGDEGWEFTLRPNARFHDGTPVTGEDVKFSLERMSNVPGAPVPFIHLAGTTRSIEVISGRGGPDIVRLLTKGFDPSVPGYAVNAWIVSAKAARNATTADFNSGKAAIGSGPWRFVAWKPGESLILARARPDIPFEEVTIRLIPDDGARLAALLSGDVDMIDSVTNSAVERIRAEKSLKLWASPSARIIYLGLDQSNAVTPQATTRDGQKLPANPLLDMRVRHALSVAIDREALVKRLLTGLGIAAGQLIPEGFVGYDPTIGQPKFDPAQAAQLLASAGFGKGFRLTLTTPNHRYPQDVETAQAVAQMWTRVGVVTAVDVLPATTIVTRADQHALSAFLIGFGSTVADAYPGTSQLVNSYDPQHGLGGLNRFGFADPEVDALFAASQAERDPAKRGALLRQVSHKVCVDDVGVIPLYFPHRIWAGRADLDYRSSDTRATSNWQAELVAPAA